MDDFFSAAPPVPSVTADVDNVDSFAQAIAGRFNNPAASLLTARLSPIPPKVNAPFTNMIIPSPPTIRPRRPQNLSLASLPGPSSPVQPSASSSGGFTSATAATLPALLSTQNLLILDIRPHSAFTTSRLPGAISLSVPSTLLKRPAFTLQKLATMLSSPSSRARFSSWRTAEAILVYDADTTSLHEGANVLGLLRKFRAEGFTRDIAWLQGGIQSLWRDNRHMIDVGAVSEDDEPDVESGASSSGGGVDDSFLRARGLPKSAFQQSTTTAPPASASKQRSSHQKHNVHHAGDGAFGHHLGPPTYTTTQRTFANPFYDNIRQNLELSQGITDRIPLELPPNIKARTKELPFAWLRSIAESAGQEEGTEALAMQFYRIELGEQRRLQGVMAHHSRQSVVEEDDHDGDGKESEEGKTKMFPFSITAGVEKGTKNRYRNIWPFEHARVRLQTNNSPDDYVNASYVQPLGTRRRYIATQGPLPTTFSDFWTLVWEQNVRVVVMLTQEIEGAVAKCGNYWKEGDYGGIHLRLVSSSLKGSNEENKDGEKTFGGGKMSMSGFDFFVPPATSTPKPDDDETIIRVFELRNNKFPDAPPRKVTQLQYLGWPDMNVPDTPHGLLKLIKLVDNIVNTAESESKSGVDAPVPDSPTRTETKERGESPVLLHCSAGVGRTGGFIMVDAVLDGVRREMRKRAERERMVKESVRAAEMHAERGQLVGQQRHFSTHVPNNTAVNNANTTGNININSNPKATKTTSVRMNKGQALDLDVTTGSETPDMMDVDTATSTDSVSRDDSPSSADRSPSADSLSPALSPGSSPPPVPLSMEMPGQHKLWNLAQPPRPQRFTSFTSSMGTTGLTASLKVGKKHHTSHHHHGHGHGHAHEERVEESTSSSNGGGRHTVHVPVVPSTERPSMFASIVQQGPPSSRSGSESKGSESKGSGSKGSSTAKNESDQTPLPPLETPQNAPRESRLLGMDLGAGPGVQAHSSSSEEPSMRSSSSSPPETTSTNTSAPPPPEFTVADADSMFVLGATPLANAAFAMDVEPEAALEFEFGKAGALTTDTDAPAGQEGPVRVRSVGGSGVDMYAARESGSNSKSSSDDGNGGGVGSGLDRWRAANMSSEDSDSYVPPVSRVRTSSNEGSGVSASGGYSSSSSIGLRAFAGLSTGGGGASSSQDRPAAGSPTKTASLLQKRAAALRASRATAAVDSDNGGSGNSTKENQQKGEESGKSRAKDLRSSSLTHSSHVSTSSSSNPSTDSLASQLSASLYESSATSNSAHAKAVPSNPDVNDAEMHLQKLFDSSQMKRLTPPSDSDSPFPPQSQAESRARSLSQSLSPSDKEDNHPSAFDYTSPRALHCADSPPPLSNLQEPIRQVLEDMREQRMSLCQSLRQYVFVHRAIIEGALEIVDENGAHVRGDTKTFPTLNLFAPAPTQAQTHVPQWATEQEIKEESSENNDEVEPMNIATTPAAVVHTSGAKELSLMSVHDSPSQHGGSKRGASPTELPKEGRTGQVLLSKRPSIKRGSGSDKSDTSCEVSSSRSRYNPYGDSP